MLKLFIILFITAALFFLRGALTPAFLGIAIAYILDPYVCWLEKKLSAKRFLCVLLAYLTVAGAFSLLAVGFADIACDHLTSGSVQSIIASLQSYYEEYKSLIKQLFGISFGRTDLVLMAQSLGSGLAKFFIGAVAAMYLLKDKDFFLRLCSKGLHLFLGQKSHGILREIAFSINDVISAFLRGVFVDSVIVAFLSSLGLALIGVDFSIFIGCFAGIANVIPYFGPVIGIIPASLIALAQGGLSKAVLAALALFAVQQIESNFIYPRIIGKSTGLHPFFVLIAVSAAGAVGGLLWMILAVPLAGIIKVLLEKWAQGQ